MIRIFIAELKKYVAESITYYPDHVVGMVITLMIFSIFSLMNNNSSDGSFYIGFVYWYLTSSMIGEASISISTEKQIGTLDQLLLKPISIEKLIVIKTVVWSLVNSIKVFVVLIVLKLFVNLNIQLHFWIIPIFLVSCLGIFGFTIMLVGLTLKFTKTASFESIISYLLLLLTGAIIPSTSYPHFIQSVANVFPLTLGINLSKEVIKNNQINFGQSLVLLIHSIVYLIIGLVFFKIVYSASKVKGLNSSY
jgi:ABC-2 type transport system permease protein